MPSTQASSENNVWSGSEISDVSVFRGKDGKSYTRIIGDSVTIIDNQTGKVVGSEDSEDILSELIYSIKYGGRGGGHNVEVFQGEDGMWYTRVIGDSVTVYDAFGREVGVPGSGLGHVGSGYDIHRYTNEDGRPVTMIVGDSVTVIDEWGREVGVPGSGMEHVGSGYEVYRWIGEDGHAYTSIVGDSVTVYDNTTGREAGDFGYHDMELDND